MFLALEQGGDIDLRDLGYNNRARPLFELYAGSNSPLETDRLARNDRYRCHSSLIDLARAQYVDYCNPVSRLQRNDERSITDLPRFSPVQHQASTDLTRYPTLEDPCVRRSREIEPTAHLSGITLNSRDCGFDQAQFDSREVAPYNGKGKGRILDPNREPGIDPTAQSYNQESLQRAKSYPPLLAANIGRDAKFERRQYDWKKYQHLQSEAHYFCTAVRRDKCKVHGKLFERISMQRKCQEDTDVGPGRVLTHGFIDEMFELDESAGHCGTVYDLSDLAEDAGQAAEKRKRDRSTLVCLEGVTTAFMVALRIAAIVIFVVEHT